MENNKQNQFISFTKWFGKWMMFAVLGIAFLALSIWGVSLVYNSKIDMFAVACESDIPNNYNMSERFYLVKKKRFEEKPYALFRPAYFRPSQISKTTKTTDVKQQYFLSRSTNTYYFFGSYKSTNPGHRINRKTGQVDFNNGRNAGRKGNNFWKPLKNCRVITPDEFYSSTRIHLNTIIKDIKL